MGEEADGEGCVCPEGPSELPGRPEGWPRVCDRCGRLIEAPAK